MLLRLKLLLGVAFISNVSIGSAFGQSAPVADGSTPTTITVGSDGHVVVDIAGATSDGVSVNRFDAFDVSEAGLSFDNRLVAARTILSEVTGSEASLIEGSIGVLGASANIILANPNGITVDGGEFINTAGVVLTTGELSFEDRQIAPGLFQTNPVFNVSGGTITVGPGGLSGAMEVLHLIARRIQVEGDVASSSFDAAARIFLTAGASRSEFNTDVLPFGNLDQLVVTQGVGAVSNGEILIDIVRSGGLSASRIQALVTDAGAGVRYAGGALASRGEFNLETTGRIELTGADITSSSSINIEAGEIVALGSDRGTQLAAINSSIELTALTGDVSLEDTTLFSADAEDISLRSDLGNVTVAGTGREDIQSAIVSGGDVSVVSAGDQLFEDSVLQVAGDYSARADGRLTVNSSTVIVGGMSSIDAEDILFASPDARTEFSSAGELDVVSQTGSIVVDGALLQGGSQDPEGTGVRLSSAQDVLVSSVDAERRGVVFAQSGRFDVGAAGDVTNASGRLISNDALTIDAGGSFDNRLGAFGQDSASLSAIVNQARGARTSFELDFGAAPEQGLDAVLTARGDIVITASEAIRNFGGELNANAGDIRLSASDVLVQSRVFGQAEYRRRCFLVCRASGSSSVETIGGSLNASGQVIVQGAESFLNLGGFVTGLEGVSIEASAITFEALLLPQIIDRPSGLYNFFTGSTSLVLWRDILGGVFSGDGEILLDSDTAVRLIGVTLDPDQVTSNAGLDVTEQDRTVSPFSEESIGLLAPLGLF